MENTAIIMCSAVTAASSTVYAFDGNDVMAWVMLGINIVTLISNAALAIYRNWRDRDKDKEDHKDEEGDQ